MAGAARVDNGKSVGNFVVVFAIFSLYLVPIHYQLGLFLSEHPFVSAFVAPLSCPVIGFSQSRLEWFEE